MVLLHYYTEISLVAFMLTLIVVGFLVIRLLQVRKKYKKLARKYRRKKQDSKLHSRLIAGASHEIRTPLAIIKSSLELMSRLYKKGGEIDSDKTEEIESRIAGEIGNITNILDNLITFGKTDSLTIHWEEIDVVGILARLTKSVELLMGKDQHIEINTIGEVKKFETDRFLFERIAMNLLTNAIKFSKGSKKNPEITVEFKPESLHLSIKDYGIGIPSGSIKDLFEPFYRSKNADRIKGNGLGLSIVKDAADLLNGTIKVKSVVSQGTVFELTFPLKQARKSN